MEMPGKREAVWRHVGEPGNIEEYTETELECLHEARQETACKRCRGCGQGDCRLDD